MTTETKTLGQQMVALLTQKRELAAELKRTEDDIKALEEPLMEEMLAGGVQNMRVDGMTLYIQRELWAARGAERESADVADALRATGHEDFTTANWQQLSSWVRELGRNATGKEKPTAEEAEAALPPELRGIVAVTERISIRGRAS